MKNFVKRKIREVKKECKEKNHTYNNNNNNNNNNNKLLNTART